MLTFIDLLNTLFFLYMYIMCNYNAPREIRALKQPYNFPLPKSNAPFQSYACMCNKFP